MRFPQYVAQQVKARKFSNKTEFLRHFSEQCGVAFISLSKLARGGLLVRYDKAKDISEATGGQVTIKELCEKAK